MALAERTLDLVNIPSESGEELELYSYITSVVALEQAYSDGESVIFAKRSGRPLVLLAGHTDTVPSQGNLPGLIEDGSIVGLGASDMKGGLAVMIELANWAATTELGYDLALLFFPREELGPAENPLPGVFDRTGLVDEAQLVICLEPTDNSLQLGCLGNLNASVVFEGRSAHSARPWLGVNAIGVAFEGLGPVLNAEPRDVKIEGLLFREVMSVTQLHAGIATNVIPARAEATINFRYAPDRTPESAAARIRELWPDATITANSPPAGYGSSRSSPGRTLPTLPPAALTRSISGRAPRATPMQSTSGSRSASSSGRSRRCGAFSSVPSERAALPRPRRPHSVSVRAAR